MRNKRWLEMADFIKDLKDGQLNMKAANVGELLKMLYDATKDKFVLEQDKNMSYKLFEQKMKAAYFISTGKLNLISTVSMNDFKKMQLNQDILTHFRQQVSNLVFTTSDKACITFLATLLTECRGDLATALATCDFDIKNLSANMLTPPTSEEPYYKIELPNGSVLHCDISNSPQMIDIIVERNGAEDETKQKS